VSNFRQIVPTFAARFAGVFADRGSWQQKWEKLRTCPWCSVPDP